PGADGGAHEQQDFDAGDGNAEIARGLGVAADAGDPVAEGRPQQDPGRERGDGQPPEDRDGKGGATDLDMTGEDLVGGVVSVDRGQPAELGASRFATGEADGGATDDEQHAEGDDKGRKTGAVDKESIDEADGEGEEEGDADRGPDIPAALDREDDEDHATGAE